MSNDYDAGYKYLFSNPELVRDLIMGFIPDDWLHSLDYSTLERVNASYVTDDLKQRHQDIIWKVKVGGQLVYLYILIEFQSRVEKYMALRLMVHQGLLYQDLVKRGEVLEDGRLPPILPIVLYNGKQRWTAAADVFDLIAPVPGLAEQFKPRVKHLVIDENAYADSELSSLKNLVAAVFRLEHSGNHAAFLDLLDCLHDWLADNPGLQYNLANWISQWLLHRGDYGILLPKVHNLLELRVMLADKLEEWARASEAEGKAKGMAEGKAKGLAEGEAKGRTEGEALLLQRLLTKRFGSVPASVVEQIAHASPPDIERWFDRALEADSLADVF